MQGSVLFSVGADRLLQDIRAYSADGIACFPRDLDKYGSERQADEAIRHWFVRLVNDYSYGNPKACAVEDNIAVFAAVQWRDRMLTYANIQVIVADCDLDDFYLGVSAEAQYLRLDLDYETLGDPFSHPLPHIHVGGGCSARFALEGGNAANIVVDFLEFVYRHYAPGQWRKWVEHEWNRHFAAVATDEDENPFPPVMEAFDSSQFNILRDMPRQLAEIKTVLRQCKDRFFTLQSNSFDRELLEYPSAR